VVGSAFLPNIMNKLGFKELSIANWLEADKPSTVWVTMLANGKIVPTTGEVWLHQLLEPQLVDAVPIEIHQLFEVARGALAYGYFFYPLYTLAGEQLYRVVEAAVSYKYESLDGPKPNKTRFEKKIDWLFDVGILTNTAEIQREQAIEQFKRSLPDTEWTSDMEIHVEGIRSEKLSWHAIRHLRNYTSHPKRQTIQMPVDAIRSLRDVAAKINTLFVES
jgi:hypothetical protein